MSDYKGFRIWPLEFQAMTSSTPGVDTSEMSNGRLSIPSTGARFWTCNDVGLKAYLEDFLQPMWDGSNGVGWSLDTDLYERLNSLGSSSKDARTFKEFNPNTLYTSGNPTGEKTVKLVPTTYCRAMFFKHTSGYRAMIGLSLYAMDLYGYISKFYEYSNIGNIADPGFIWRHVYAESTASNYGSYYPATGGLFIAMIPPANDGDSQDEWLPEFSIRDERFYPPTMSPIVPMMHTYWYYSSGAGQYYNGSCWLKTGTSTVYNSTSSGVLVGTNMKTCLLLDSKGNIGLTYKYTGTSNTTSLKPMMFIGPMYSEPLTPASDTLCTRKLAIITINICGRYTSYSGTQTGAFNHAAWISSQDGTYYNTRFYNMTDDYYYIGYISHDGNSYGNAPVYTAYPALDSSVLTNYRYAKAGYINARLIDEEVIRWSSVSGLVEGQTYNDGQWVCLPYTYSLRAQDGMTSSYYLWPQLRWDGDFNDTKTFA